VVSNIVNGCGVAASNCTAMMLPTARAYSSGRNRVKKKGWRGEGGLKADNLLHYLTGRIRFQIVINR
jgi:hypothetical protein